MSSSRFRFSRKPTGILKIPDCVHRFAASWQRCMQRSGARSVAQFAMHRP
jgi:hypothetical protein